MSCLCVSIKVAWTHVLETVCSESVPVCQVVQMKDDIQTMRQEKGERERTANLELAAAANCTTELATGTAEGSSELARLSVLPLVYL